MEKSLRCDICSTDVHKTSFAKHLRSKKHLEQEKQNGIILPDWSFQDRTENKGKNFYNPKPLRQIAGENNKLNDKELNKVLAKKMINPYYFTDWRLRVGFNITLESRYINHTNSKITIKPNYPEFEDEFRYLHKILKKMTIIYARLINSI